MRVVLMEQFGWLPYEIDNCDWHDIHKIWTIMQAKQAGQNKAMKIASSKGGK